MSTWISRFCQGPLVLSTPSAIATSDICGVQRYGKPCWLEGVADAMLSSRSRARGCQEGSVSALLAPGSPCAWVKLVCSVGSAGSFGGGAVGVERCSCSINRPDGLGSRD